MASPAYASLRVAEMGLTAPFDPSLATATIHPILENYRMPRLERSVQRGVQLRVLDECLPQFTR